MRENGQVIGIWSGLGALTRHPTNNDLPVFLQFIFIRILNFPHLSRQSLCQMCSGEQVDRLFVRKVTWSFQVFRAYVDSSNKDMRKAKTTNNLSIPPSIWERGEYRNAVTS
jgi:hypothetical protein